MRKPASAVLSLVVLVTMVFSAGIAGAAPAPVERAAPAISQEIGDAVVVNGIDGNEVGTATITDIVDPFEDMEQTPERGLRFLSIELEFENTGENVLTVDPQNIGVVDEMGIIYVDVEVDRTDRLDSLASTDLEPGNSISGTLEVGFPEDGEIAQIIWLVGTGQLPILLDYSDPTAIGDPVTLFTTDYDEEAVFTVEEVADNFDELASRSRPEEGKKVVGVSLTIENVTDDAITPVPGSVFLTTSDGIFWAPVTDLERPRASRRAAPDLTDEPIDAGDSVTGFVAYLVPEDVEVVNVFYLPDSARLIRIYNPGGPGSDKEDDNGGLGPIGKKTPTAEDANGNSNSGDECAGAADWAELAIETLGVWGGFFGDLDLENATADTPDLILEGAETIRDLADQLRESSPPPAAEELNELIIQAYENSAEALENLAEGINTSDSDLITESLATIANIGTSFQSGEVADVLAEAEDACPELSDL